MVEDTQQADSIQLAGAPEIPGRRFRRFRGAADYPGMAAVLAASLKADGIDWIIPLADLAKQYDNLKNCDPRRDMLMVELDGELVGSSRVSWLDERADDGSGTLRIYSQRGNLVPRLRGLGIERAILRYNEARLLQIAAGHSFAGPRSLRAGTTDHNPVMVEVLASARYKPARYSYEMIRPDLEGIPELPLPEGIRVRPVEEHHLCAIWEAEEEAFHDHRGIE